MLYHFKQTPSDFQVTEILPFTPSGEGEFLYIFFEKKEINTMDIVSSLCKELKLNRYDIGIAGLKDRQGITKQRISIGQKTLSKIGGEVSFIKVLQKYSQILQKTYHTELLKVGMNSGNHFEILLRAQQEIPSKTKHLVQKNINTIKYNGFPNFFGMQRFGKGFRNVKRAEKFLYKGEETNEKHIKFNLQAFASFYFNQFIQERLQFNDFLVGEFLMNGNNATTDIGYRDGEKIQLFDYRSSKEKYADRDFFSPDFLGEKIDFDSSRIPAGPIIGKNILLPPNPSPAFQFERNFLKKLKFFELDLFSKFQLYGLRRPILVFPKDLQSEFDSQNNLLLKFSLPTGSYATVFLGTIFQSIDPATCKENGLQIPSL